MRKYTMTLILAALIATAAIVPTLAQESDPLAVLKSDDAPRKAKSDACRVLSYEGGPEAIPVLTPILLDEELSHMARYALEPMAYPEAGDAIRDALGKTTGRLKIGMISSLAMRKDTKAVPEIITLLADADEAIACAAARALADIATPEAVAALTKAVAQSDLTPGKTIAFCDASIIAAEALVASGKNAEAAAIYESIAALPNASDPACAAALRGAVLAKGIPEGLSLLVEALRGEDENLFIAALRTARDIDANPLVSAALSGELPTLQPERKIRVMHVLGQRGEGDASGPALLNQAGDGPAEVRVAAIKAMVRMGYAPVIPLVQGLLLSEDKTLAKAACDGLSYFPGTEGDAALTAMLGNSNAELRRLAVELVGQGGIESPIGLLMRVAATDTDEGIRIEALKAIENHATMDEMPGLIERLGSAASAAEVKAVEKALSAMAERQQRMSAAADVVIKKAVYGDLSGGKIADVTGKVSEMVANGATSIDASNANFGDPASGVVKQLRIEYAITGQGHSQTVNENQSIRLAAAVVPPAIVDAFCSAIDSASGEAKLALIRLLRVAGSPKAFEKVIALASADDASVKETALRAVCEWPTTDALPKVMELALNASDQTIQVLATRGAVRLLRQSPAGDDECLAQYAKLMAKAGPEEKKTVISGIAQIHNAAALEMVLAQFSDAAVKAEATQAAVAIAETLGAAAKEDPAIFNGKDLTGWDYNPDAWSFDDGAFLGHTEGDNPRNQFIWSNIEVADFYLSVDVKLDPNTLNGGIQFRSKKINDSGQACGYQADMGQNVWGRLYHEQGRGKLFWDGRAEEAVVPGEWNRCEILAVGPAIWTAINGKLGVSFLDPAGQDERKGLISFQIHAGPPPNIHYRVNKLIHNPKIELGDLKAKQLIAELKGPDSSQ